MSQNKRIVRKISADPLADFDEQWWPITLLLLIAAGALAGYVYYSPESNFDTPVWYRNARVHLVLIGAAAVALVAGIAMLRGSAQRRLQLGVFLSLAFHVALIYWSQQMYLTFVELAPADEALELDEEVAVVIPDYIEETSSADSIKEMTKPAETKAAEMEEQAEMKPQLQENMPAEKESVSEPDPLRDPLPTPVEVARAELTAQRTNEVLSGEQLSRKTIAEPLPSEKALQPKPLEGIDPSRQSPQALADAARREQEAEAARRPTLREARIDPAVPETSDGDPTKRSLSDAVAMVDEQAALERQMRAAMPESTPAPQTELPVMARPSILEPRRTATVETAATAEQRSAAPLAPSQRESPAITISPGAMTTIELSRAITPEPSEAGGMTPAATLPKQAASSASAAGIADARVEAPAAPSSDPSQQPGGTSSPSPPTSVNRGSSGSPQLAMAEGFAAPSIPGAGAGQVAGSAFVGPQRAATVGEGETGQASGANLLGRAGRGRTTGTANVAAEQVAALGMSGTAGATQTPGNSSQGASTDVRALSGGAATGLGERMSGQQGAMMRIAPSGGTPGNGQGTTGAVSGEGLAALGNAIGGGSASATGAARRELGDGIDADRNRSAGPTIGAARRGKISASDGTASLAGAGAAAMPQAGASGAGAAGQAAGGSLTGGSSIGGSMGVGKASIGRPVLVEAPEGPGGLASRPSSDIGMPTRRNRPQSEATEMAAGRLIPERLGGKKSGGDGLRDRHGNLIGSANDLIADGQMVGEKIVIITFYVDEDIESSPLIGALAAKGYAVERLTAALPPIADFARQLDGARQLWLVSSEVNRLPEAYLRELLDRWRGGRLALCLLADNEPFTAEATAVLNAIAPGTTISGDYLGEQKLFARENETTGFDAALPIFHNVDTLFEGTTISHINSRQLTPVCFASNGRPLIGIYQQEGSSRLLVHCGFTSIYQRFWDDAGVSRFAVNVAGWLSESDKKAAAAGAPIRIIPTPR